MDAQTLPRAAQASIRLNDMDEGVIAPPSPSAVAPSAPQRKLKPASGMTSPVGQKVKIKKKISKEPLERDGLEREGTTGTEEVMEVVDDDDVAEVVAAYHQPASEPLLQPPVAVADGDSSDVMAFLRNFKSELMADVLEMRSGLQGVHEETKVLNIRLKGVEKKTDNLELRTVAQEKRSIAQEKREQQLHERIARLEQAQQ